MNEGEKKLIEAAEHLNDTAEKLGKAIDKMASLTALSICGMTICCIILGVVAIFA